MLYSTFPSLGFFDIWAIWSYGIKQDCFSPVRVKNAFQCGASLNDLMFIPCRVGLGPLRADMLLFEVISTVSLLVEQSTPAEHLIFDATATVGGRLAITF